MSNIKILDCTIRDGGYVNNWQFTDEQVKECYKGCLLSKVDYMEIGFRNLKEENLKKKYGETFFLEESYINRIFKEYDSNGPKLAIMVTINLFDIKDFVPKVDSKISLVRVLMAYHGSKNINDDILDINLLMEGVKQINQLVDLGYEISFNIGRIDKISKENLFKICEIISKINVKYFIVADTYGSVDLNYIEIIIPYIKFLFKEVFLNNLIEIGFHAHDNCANATSKALYSLKFGVTIIDSCILGYGRGSGNAKTELIMMDLNKNYNKNYDFIKIINYGDNHLINYKDCINNLCYNVVYALGAYFGCHVSYSIDIIELYEKMNIEDIYNVFKKLKEIKKNMFYWEKLFLEIYNKLKN